MIKKSILWLLPASLPFLGCTGSGESSCDAILGSISRELGPNPKDSIWLPLTDTTRDIFCDTSLIDSLRKTWGFKDTSTVFAGTQMNVIRIISLGPYRARISIFDKNYSEVRSLVQYFGLKEIDSCREKPSRRTSFLVWDMRDQKNEEVPDGIYNWKITFDGYFGTYSTSMKTGVILKSCEKSIE